MALPPPVEALWSDLESVRARLLKEVESLSQAQADWRARDTDWSVGEIIHHLTLAEGRRRPPCGQSEASLSESSWRT